MDELAYGDEGDDLAAAASRAQTVADLGALLRVLRRREAKGRPGPELSYRQLTELTGWARGSVFGYLTGLTLAPADRLRELVRLLGARPDEQAALDSAHARVAGALQAADATARALAGRVAPPRTLPAAARAFTGRAAELACLDDLLSIDAMAGTVLISAVAGMGGVGKTALAVQWAHRVAGRFPDGQIYVNLRGYDPAEPLSTMDALGVVLAGLGVPPSALPGALAQRMALYRRLLAGRTMLVLLDNAAGVDQVRPLLPPPPCLAVVTSRDDLAELVASERARRVTLDVLPEQEARALLRLLIGERADQEPDAVLTLTRLCGHLPLALRVAAEQANAQPLASLAELVGEFAAEPDDWAGQTDERSDIRAVFSWSVRRLPAQVGRVFRLLGLVPGADIDEYGLAALADVDVATAGSIAQTLCRAHLLQGDDAGRYSMHDLVRAYAAESAVRMVPGEERVAAVARLLDYYRAAAVAAIQAAGHESRLVEGHHQRLGAWSGAIPDVGAPDRAAAWLAGERTNLVHSCLHAARHGWPRHAVALATELQAFLDNGYDQDALAVQTAALAAAEGMGNACDPRDVAGLALCLSAAHRRAGALAECRSLAERTLAEYTRLGDVTGAVGSLVNLGAVHDWQGRFDDAYDCFVRALDLARSAGLPVQEGRMLMSLATLHGRRERYDIAADYALRAAAVFEGAGDRLMLAEARHGAAFSLAALGQHDEASTMAEEALAIHLDHGGPMQRGISMIAYGLILKQVGRVAEAVEVLSGAVVLGRDTDSLMVTVQALNALGEALCEAGDHRRAIDCHTEAGELAERFGDLLEVACAEEGLGRAHDAVGETDRAREHWTRAGGIYADLGHPAAERLEQQLERITTE